MGNHENGQVEEGVLSTIHIAGCALLAETAQATGQKREEIDRSNNGGRLKKNAKIRPRRLR
jgi:hypothetical protein